MILLFRALPSYTWPLVSNSLLLLLTLFMFLPDFIRDPNVSLPTIWLMASTAINLLGILGSALWRRWRIAGWFASGLLVSVGVYIIVLRLVPPTLLHQN